MKIESSSLDFNLKKSKIRRKSVNFQGSTVRISMKIEYGLLQDIKQSSEKKGLPYQTFIKQILREYLNTSTLEQRVQKLEEKLCQLEARI